MHNLSMTYVLSWINPVRHCQVLIIVNIFGFKTLLTLDTSFSLPMCFVLPWIYIQDLSQNPSSSYPLSLCVTVPLYELLRILRFSSLPFVCLCSAGPSTFLSSLVLTPLSPTVLQVPHKSNFSWYSGLPWWLSR